MKNTLITTLLVLLTLCIFAQNNTINGTIPGLVGQKVYLLKLSGEKKTIVDTTHSDYLGSFSLNINNQEPGMYALITGNEQAIELIYNNEDIRFTTTGMNNEDGIQIIESVENLIYYDYLNLKGINLYKMDLLNTLIQQYPPNDEFYATAVEKYFALQRETNDHIDKLVENNPGTIAVRYISTDRPIVFDPRNTVEQQSNFIKKHYFDNVDFNDTILINSTILTSKAVNYLSLFQDEAESQEELEDKMLAALDTIFQYASVNQKTYEFLTDFFIVGFESIGFDKGLTYIAENNSLENFCENTERKAKLENKLDLIKKLSLGKTAPDFTTKDIEGNEITLSKVKADKTVLVFWASWCQHCEDIIPFVEENVAKNPDIKVIAISIDESEQSLTDKVKEFGYDWTYIGELKGWDGPIIDEYGVAATPTIFVLDKDKKIIAKPLSKADIVSALGN